MIRRSVINAPTTSSALTQEQIFEILNGTNPEGKILSFFEATGFNLNVFKDANGRSLLRDDGDYSNFSDDVRSSVFKNTDNGKSLFKNIAGNCSIYDQITGSKGLLEYVNRALSAKDLFSATGGTGAYYLTGLNVYNPNATTVFLKFYDAASTGAVTIGTTLANYIVPIPALSSIILENTATAKKQFTSGVVLAALTGYLDTDTTAPATALYLSVAQFKYLL